MYSNLIVFKGGAGGAGGSGWGRGRLVNVSTKSPNLQKQEQKIGRLGGGLGEGK